MGTLPVEVISSESALLPGIVVLVSEFVQLVDMPAIVQLSGVSEPSDRTVSVTVFPAPGAAVDRTERFVATKGFVGARVWASASVAVTIVGPVTEA